MKLFPFNNRATVMIRSAYGSYMVGVYVRLFQIVGVYVRIRHSQMMGVYLRFIRLFCLVMVGVSLAAPAQTEPAKEQRLSLANALQTVLKQDFQLNRLAIEANAYAAEGEAKNVLADPILFAAMQNIPTDTFELDQEAMTQFRFGLKQMFPKGDSLSLNQQIAEHSRQERLLMQQQVARHLRQQTEIAWLEAWYWQKNRDLIEQDRVFLNQMRDFMQSVYRLGGNTQSDLLGAELELIKLDEKVIEAERQYQTFRLELNTLANSVFPEAYVSVNLPVSEFQSLPEETALYRLLSRHPAIAMLDENVAQLDKKVRLSEQDFEPEWGLELSYAYREDMPNGTNRADLLSAGLSVQLPLFSRPQKTQAVRSVKYRQAAIENKRLEMLQKVRFELLNLAQQYQSTHAQRRLYESQILPTLGKQKDSAIQSYEADKGDFKVVTDLYLKEQSTRLKFQRLRVNEQILIARMNYWLDANNPDLIDQPAHTDLVESADKKGMSL